MVKKFRLLNSKGQCFDIELNVTYPTNPAKEQAADPVLSKRISITDEWIPVPRPQRNN